MDNIHLQGGREALMRGIKKACNTIAGTLGPKGYSLVLEDVLFPGHLVTNDGWAILKKIKLADPLEQRGVELLKEAVEKSNKESGDGSTTATILTSAILEEGLKLNTHGQEIKDSLDACLCIIEKSIDDQTKQITPEEVGQVATISSGDEKIGAILQEIYTKVGKDGIVEMDNSNTPETFYEIVEGVRLKNAGFMYPYMTNDERGRSATYLNPKILITKQKINVQKDIDPLMQKLIAEGASELVIFCDDIDPSVSNLFAMTHQQGLFKTLVIKAPTLWKNWLFEDFALMTGATIIDPEQGLNLKRLELRHLGTCEKLIAKADETLVFGTQDLTAHIEKLKEDGKIDDQQLLRASWLQTKTAILKVGASSESELSLKRLKVEDARNAAYQALQGGIVVGGGIALFTTAQNLPDTIGGKILKQALTKPLWQIIGNADIKNILSDLSATNGFDAKSGETVDMWKAGIVDAAPIIKNAVRNAISVAGTILTSNGVITIEK